MFFGSGIFYIRDATIGMTMTEFDRITINPARMNGQPCIRNMRLTVRRVIEILAAYSDREEIRPDYPELEDEDIRQALRYAATYLDDRIVEFSVPYEPYKVAA